MIEKLSYSPARVFISYFMALDNPRRRLRSHFPRLMYIESWRNAAINWVFLHILGKLYYEKAFGYRSLKDASNPDPMPIDATMWLASCTKLIGTIAAMQCVERGQLKLDEDVTTILPELKGIQILKGFEKGLDGEDKPILVPNTKTITLRWVLARGPVL